MSVPHFRLENDIKAEFLKAIEEKGVAVIENVIEPSVIEQLKKELLVAIDKEAEFHGTKEYKDYGMLLACPIYGGKLLEICGDENLMRPFHWLIGESCIIYVYTSSSMPPNGTNYSARIHVDRPHFIPGYTEAVGCLVMLNDFNPENGATWVLPGSHFKTETPDEDYFYKNAVRVEAPAGSVVYFHLRLWHAGGVNKTNEWRHSLGIGVVRPYMKQRIDLPRALQGVDLTGVNELGMQKLGFYSQPPTSLAEFHSPPEKRTYKQKSEWD